jgi:hypothetical protein
MYRVISNISPIISRIRLTIWYNDRTLNYMNFVLKPTTSEEWIPTLLNCYATRRSLQRGRDGFFPRLYVPPMLQWTIELHEPGDELFTFLTLIRDLFLSQACAPDTIFAGRLSDLETEAEIESALITHICDIVERLVKAPAGSLTDQTHGIVQLLNYELEDLQQTGLTQILDSQQSVEGITSTCETYLMACVVHPEIDIDGSNAEWMFHLFQGQPNMRLGTGDYEESPEPLYALVQLLRQCFSSNQYDFVRVFEAFGRWTVTMTVDHLRNLDSYLDSEDRFLADVDDDLTNPLSRIPLDLRKAMCNINLRSMYEDMFYKMREILEYGPDIRSIDVLNYKLWQWALEVIMQSSLEHRYKVRIGIWMLIRGDEILESEYSLVVPLPGQSVLSRLPWEDLIITERPPWAMQEPTEDLKDVEFEAVGPLLDPSAYAETLDNSGDWMDELCIVCLERLGDDRSSPAKILVCGHLSHWDCLSKLINGISEWSNKCPLCRRKICSPRQKRALIESVVNDEVGDGFYHPTAEYFQDSDVDDLVTNLEELGVS